MSPSKLKLKLRRGVKNEQKAVIVVYLVEESIEMRNEEIEKEIMKTLSSSPPVIPWLRNVEKVTVTRA